MTDAGADMWPATIALTITLLAFVIAALDRGCPVYSDGPLPDCVYARWRVHVGLSLHPDAADLACRQAQERRQRGER
jgi:hypothetical protein